MTYSLSIWIHPKTGEERIYLNGTTRRGIYIKWSGDKCVWSSKTNDTPNKFRSGDHYGKVRKDSAAVGQVLERFGYDGTKEIDADAFERLRQIAKDDLIVA